MTLRAAFRVRRPRFDVVVDLEVAAGTTLALLGPNGTGKTTVLEAIAGVVEIDDGVIELDGATLHTEPPERRRVGLAFQDGMLFPRMSALDNVAFPRRARGERAAEARRRARELLARLAPDVEPRRRPPELSGGERQRVALARTLAAEPVALLLDEPLAAADASARPSLRDAIRDALARFDGPAILVTHDPVDAMTLGDRLALLERGRVTQIGTPAEIRNHPRTRYAADLVGQNLFQGTLRPADDGSGVLQTADGSIAVAWPEDVSRGVVADVAATLAPADVAIHATRPEGSARNVVRGPILEVATAGGRARVRIASAPQIVAEVTSGSADRLGLSPGLEVWASWKAVEIHLMVPGTEPDTL